MASLDLLQRPLVVLVLETLAGGPRHGDAIARWIRETPEGDFEIEEGARPPAPHRLERRGWVTSAWGVSEHDRRAKYDEPTPQGRQRLRAERTAWERYTTAVGKVLPAQ